MLFLSNAVSITNPYFDHYHLDKPYNGDIQRFGNNKNILVQNVVCEKVRQAKLATEFYQLNADSEYLDYAVNNEWLLDNEDFIEKKPNAHSIGLHYTTKERTLVYGLTLYNGGTISVLTLTQLVVLTIQLLQMTISQTSCSLRLLNSYHG